MRCLPAHHFTVAKARAWRSAIDDDPVYQRAGDVWTLNQRERFIDSLLNGYDVPKIYLHDQRGIHPTKVYAVVDGKQRLHAIWSFLADGFPLASDFTIESVPAEIGPTAVVPAGALRFSAMDPRWQAHLLRTYLSVVLIRDATEDDIDQLFARLNDGSPLTPAERRNAFGGRMAALIRELADRPELRSLLPFADTRGAYREVVARLLAYQEARRVGVDGAVSLGPDDLDAFVRANRRSDGSDADARAAALDRLLRLAVATFRPSDPILANPDEASRHLMSLVDDVDRGSTSGRRAPRTIDDAASSA
jgi:hypothetical protein